MQVLVCYVVYIFRCRQLCRSQAWHWARRGKRGCDVVYACRSSLRCRYADGIGFLHVVNLESHSLQRCPVERRACRQRHCSERRVVECYAHCGIVFCRHADIECSPAYARRHRQLAFLCLSYSYGVAFVEVSATVIPCIVVYFAQRVIVVVGRIKTAGEGERVDRHRLRIALRYEIITIVAVRVAYSRAVGRAFPRYGSFGVEQATVACLVCRHFLQVVGCDKSVGVKLLVLQVPAVAVYLHFAYVGESCLTHEGVGQLVDTACRHAYLCPLAFSQHRVCRVSLASCAFRAPDASSLRALQRCRFHVEHEADEYLLLAVSHHQRHKRHVEVSLAAVYADVGFYIRHFLQRHARYRVVACCLACRHVEKLRIAQAYAVC